MLDARTTEILAAIQRAAHCTPDLLPLLEAMRTVPESIGPDRVVSVEVQG